jgi:hypothetical protein
MAEHERRVAKNEAIFRATNERLEAINEAFAVVTEDTSLFCECGDIDCTERVTLGVAEYEALRGAATHFVVLPRHVHGSVERVVSRTDRYWIVQKDSAEAAEIAETLDPRA